MSIYDSILTRDSHGFIRFPENLKLTEQQTKKLADQLFISTASNVGIKQLDTSFNEDDNQKGLIKKNPNIKWDNEQRKLLLLKDSELENDSQVANALNEEFGTNRSEMSIYMQKSWLLSNFNAWRNDNSKELKDLTYEQIVNKYFE